MCHTLQMYVLRRDQGRLGRSKCLVRRVAGENPTYPILRCARTLMVAELGNVAEARESLAALVGRLTFDEEWLVSMGFLAETAHALAGRRVAPPASTGRCAPTPIALPSACPRSAPARSRAARAPGHHARPVGRRGAAFRDRPGGERANRRPVMAGAHPARVRRDADQARCGPVTRRPRGGSWPRRGRPTASSGSHTELQRHRPRDARDGLPADPDRPVRIAAHVHAPLAPHCRALTRHVRRRQPAGARAAIPPARRSGCR